MSAITDAGGGDTPPPSSKRGPTPIGVPVGVHEPPSGHQPHPIYVVPNPTTANIGRWVPDGKGGYTFTWYTEGDEWKPGKNPERAAEIQQKLVDAGLLDPADVRPNGAWDARSALAYKEVLSYANMHGITQAEALNDLVANPVPKDASATGRQPNPLVFQVPDDATLYQTIDSVASKTLGRKLSDQEKVVFASSYKSTLMDAQRAAYVANYPNLDPSSGMPVDTSISATGANPTPGAPTVTVQAPDAATAAEDFARRVDPGGYEAHGAADLYTQLLNFIGVNYG